VPNLDQAVRQAGGSGGEIYSDDPCEHIRFSNEELRLDPSATRTGTREGWDLIQQLCPTEPLLAPLDRDQVLNNANESEPGIEGDSGETQGVGGNNVGSNLENPTEIEPPLNKEEEPTRPPDGQRHPTHSDELTQQQTDAGDPVDIFSGSLYLNEVDLEVPNTILPLTFSRFYRSGAAAFGPFGWNWDHNHNLFVRELQNGNIALWRNLHEDVFVFNGADFEPPRGVFERLVRVAGLAQVFEVMGTGGIVMRFERPVGWIDGERVPIIWAKDRHGNHLKYSYGSEDKLDEVADDDGRFIRFEYDQCGLLVAAFDHSGRRFTYDHNEESQHLLCVTSPPTSDHPEGIARIYHYEKLFAPRELRHNIIRVEDSVGNVYLENQYEQDPASWQYARVTEQLYGGFLYQFRYTQLQWVPANPVYINIPALRVEVMNPDFGLETYTFNYRGDLLDRRFRLNKDKSFRVVVWRYEFDVQGNLSITTKPDGSQEINTYDFGNPDPRMRGNLLRKELTSATGFPSPSRIVWRAKYEPTYQLLTEEKNELGAAIEYKYDFNINPGFASNSGKLLEVHHPDVTLPDGTAQSSVTKLENNDKGQVTARIQVDGVRHEMTYGNTGNTKSRVTKQIYDATGLGIETSIKYDAFGFDVENIDGNGNSTKKSINSLGLLEKITLPPINGSLAEYHLHYNTDKKVIAYERPKGTYTSATFATSHIIEKFERDVLGYPTKYYLSSNTEEERIISICPDFRGFPVETTNPDGSKIKRLYDERGLLIGEEVIGRDGSQLSSKRVYDRSSKLAQETNSFGQTTKYEYDGFSRIIKITLPNNTHIKYKWIKGDLLESEEVVGDDGLGIIRQLSLRTYAYDEKGRKISETVKSFEDDPTASVDVATTFFYDQLNGIEKIVDNRGGIRTFHYDGMGRTIKEVDPVGNEDHFAYDNNGNLVQRESHHIEPDGTTSVITKSSTYDARNRRIELIEPDGAKFIFEYDDRNLLVGRTDYLGVIQKTKYDSSSNKVEETHDVGGLSITHKWILDNMSRMTSYVDPTGQVSKYHMDGVGRIYKTEYPNGFSSIKSFNNKGQVIEETLGSGVKFEFAYDHANRLVSIENINVPAHISQLQAHKYIYDGLDRLVSAKVGANEVIREYDSQSRMLSETTLGNLLRCKYIDASGEVEKIWNDGRTEKRSHDLNGILTQIEETANGTLGNGANIIASYKPSGGNFFGEASYQGGINILNKYDERKRLVEIGVSSPTGVDEKVKYRYDTVNRKRVEAISGQNPKLSFFEFDDKYRLSAAKDGFASPIPDALTQAEHNAAINAVKTASAGATHEEVFEYNKADARTKHTESGSPDKNYVYASGHRIHNDGANAYNHHTDGALQSDGLFTYETDALGRIREIKSGINTVCKIEYDALGRPSIVEEAGKPIRSFNYIGDFVEQENENGIASRQITIHPVTGVPVAYHSASRTDHTLFDSRFELIGLTDSSGNLIETYRYKPFGFPEIFDATGAKILTSSFGIEPVFGGQRFLSSTGLYLSKRRLMNPINGMFLSTDPFGYVDSPSLYVYVSQDPIDLVDPEGELALLATILIGAAIGGAISAFANRDKQGADFWVSVGAGAVAGGIMGTGYGLVSFALGGAVGGAIMGGYEGGVEGALIYGSVGAIGGLVGGAIGGRASTAVAGRLYGTLFSRMSATTATQYSQYVGVGIGGATAGYYSSLSQGTLSLIASGESPLDHPELLLSNTLEGAGYGMFGGVTSKAMIQSYAHYKTNTTSGMFGAEAEFSVQNQTMQRINTRVRVPNVNGNPRQSKIPDLHGKIIGDVKNTSKIPSLNEQNNQLRSFLAANRARGTRMPLFYRPGVNTGPRHSVRGAGDIDLVPIRQFTPPFQPVHPNETISSK